MSKLSKRVKDIQSKVTPGALYKLEEALELLKSFSKVKFNESVDVSFNLGVDPRKSDQVVRGATQLPHGTGKMVRVAVFAQGAQADAAQAAGAERVGFEDLAEDIKKGQIDFDVLIATPDAMKLVGPLGQILGPKGLMPNPKVGTVTPDAASAVEKVKSGQVQYRTDKSGIVHSAVGKVDFSVEHLIGNIRALLDALNKAKPATAKGVYIKKLTVSTTMGPGLAIDTLTV